jgi:hypothetical protein
MRFSKIRELPKEIVRLEQLSTLAFAVQSTLPKEILKKLLTTGTMVGRIDQLHVCTTLGSFPGFSIGGIDWVHLPSFENEWSGF